MRIWPCALAAVVAGVALQARAQPAGDDFRRTKEWKALDRCVGVWEGEVNVAVPQPRQGREIHTVSWLLDTRFLQLTNQPEGDVPQFMFLFGYDPTQKALRGWWFNSAGRDGTFDWSWDEPSATLSMKLDGVGPGACTITSRFTDDDHREGHVILKDADGKVTYEVTSKATRQKAPAKLAADARVAPADAQFKQTAQWKALNRYVGSWESQKTVTIPAARQTRESATSAWVLGERFLEFKVDSDVEDSKGYCLYAPDPAGPAIRCWWFNASGEGGTASGDLDAATGTMTVKINVAAGLCTITDRLVDDDHAEGKIVFKDNDGKVLYEASGKSTRKKK